MDATENSDYSGTLYNPYLPEPVAFGQVKDIITALEEFFDSIAYPQPYFRQRTFGQSQEDLPKVAAIPELYQGQDVFEHRGRLATFVVEVRQRQNASWQGSVNWLEGDLQRTFQSTLELLKLMDSAIEQGVFSA